MRFQRRLESGILETMSEKIEQVTNQALSLPPIERTKLIDRLYESLRSDEERAVERAWAEESERRINAYGRGDTGSVSYQDMKRELPPRDG
jgi:putative addiction module component (TIGR02574 family)